MNKNQIDEKTINWFQSQNFSCEFDDPEYQHPTSEDIKIFRLFTGWSQSEFAKVVGVNYQKGKGSSTIRKWCSPASSKEHRKIPYSAWRLCLITAGIVVQKIR